MRKHSARKWLHFILDLLPVIILPIFALYEINHDQNEPISITYSENKVVDFNQLFTSDFQNNYISCNDTIVNFTNVDANYTVDLTQIDLVGGHKYVIRYNPIYTNLVNPQGATNFLWFNSSTTNVGVTYNNNSALVTIANSGRYNVRLRCNETALIDTSIFVNIFDLTQMYGDGNEPTLNNFNLTFTDDNYDYVLSKNMIVDSVTHTFDDTDVGSQMIYALYNPIKNYFNFNNVFNFGNIYQWFELNIFGGTAPVSFFIVWNIVLYQFVMDLVFLIYGLFMWFIDMCEKLMDKPLNSIK